MPREVGGNLGAPLVTPITLAYPEIDRIVVSDFNGDGVVDLLAIGIGSGTTLFLGYGDGFFRPGLEYALGLDIGASSFPEFLVSPGDRNGDGRLDLSYWNGIGIGTALQGTCVTYGP
jgi:hypothetical protein